MAERQRPPAYARRSDAPLYGLAGKDFIATIEGRIGHTLPESFYEARRAEDVRAMAEGVAAIGGAVAFVKSLPVDFPKAIVSSSPTVWIDRICAISACATCSAIISIAGASMSRAASPPPTSISMRPSSWACGSRIARSWRTPRRCDRCGGERRHVIGMCMGTHCAIGHDQRLRDIGVAAIAQDYEDVRRELGF